MLLRNQYRYVGTLFAYSITPDVPVEDRIEIWQEQKNLEQIKHTILPHQ